MSKKESFIVYADWMPFFDALETDTERVQLLKAIFHYNASGETPIEQEHTRVFNAMFSVIKGHLDRDIEKYQKKVEKNRENAKKSHQADATNCKQSQANATERYRTQPNAADNDNDNDNVNDNEVISNDITICAKTRKRFIKPTVEEVREYCRERGNTVDADTFVNFYESKGWMVGKNHMKDWKSAVRTWEQSRRGETKPQETFSSFETDEFFQAALADSRRKMNNAENA